MKRGMSRGEWLLICGPLVLFGVFAAVYARWKAVTPASLSSSPHPLRSAVPIYDGRSIVALGEEVDASNNHAIGSPWHFLRWSTKDGSLNSQFDESRMFYNWNLSRDGELLAMHMPGLFKAPTSRSLLGTMIVRRTDNGSEIASWSTATASSILDGMIISPDKREILTLSKNLERHDLMSGKILGTLKASQVFSPGSRFDRVSFSPDGRMIAVIESALYSPSSSTVAPSQKMMGMTSAQMGGRMAVLTFPALQMVMHPKGDLYSDCGWESNERLWAVAPVSVGGIIQKLVRSKVDLKSKQTQLEPLELPSDYSSWNQRTLAINGPTAQVVLAGTERVVVWGPDGQITMTLKLPAPTAPKGGMYPPGVNAPPRFSRDGRALFRVSGKNVERTDLSHFLSEATPVQTSTP